VSEVEGNYECHLYDGEGKNDWHFAELRRSSATTAPTLTWSNRAGVSWTLTPSLDANVSSKLLVATDCPYFDDGYQVCDIQRSSAGRIVGVLGPNEELYSRTGVAEASAERGLTELPNAEKHVPTDDDTCMIEVAPVTVSNREVSSEAGRAEAPPALVLMAAVVDSKLSVRGDQPLFEDTELRGDVTEEFSDLLKHYPNVTEAYRLGCVALSFGAAGGASTATSKIMVKNTGTLPWSESTSLRSVAGPDLSLSALPLGAVPAGDIVEIVLDFVIKHSVGGRSAWAMCDGSGEPFGPLLLFETINM